MRERRREGGREEGRGGGKVDRVRRTLFSLLFLNISTKVNYNFAYGESV